MINSHGKSLSNTIQQIKNDAFPFEVIINDIHQEPVIFNIGDQSVTWGGSIVQG